MTQIIGRYRIIEEIGHGGFAKVYKAQDTSLDRYVAIKVMHPALMSDVGFVARFQQEAKTVANLQHPHIIPIHDYGEFEGRLFIVMKLMKTSVFSRIQQGPVPWEQAKKIVDQVSSALDLAHSKDIIHRDVKPENILLGENLDAVIADFGLVKALEQSSLSVSLSSNSILGTPAYLPPEVWNGERVTPAADIYALACVVYEMVTGKKLFHGPTPPATMTLHFRAPQFPETWPKGIPAGISGLLAKALDPNPSKRYSSAGNFSEALSALVEDPLAKNYANVINALSEKNWVEAISLAELILEDDPNYKDVSTLLQKAIKEKAESETLLLKSQWREQAEEAIKQEEWPSAIAAAKQWMQIAPDDPSANLVLANAVDKQINKQKNTSKLQKFPKWIWATVILFTILFSAWGLTQLVGNNGGNLAEGTTSSTSNDGEVIASLNTETLTSTPTNTPTKTPFSSSTPSQTPNPTKTPSPTKTNTSTSTRTEPTITSTPTKVSTPTSVPTLTKTLTPTGTSIPADPITNSDWMSQIQCFSPGEVFPVPGSEVSPGMITFSWPNKNTLPEGYFYYVAVRTGTGGSIAGAATKDNFASFQIGAEWAGDIKWDVTLKDSNGEPIVHHACNFSSFFVSEEIGQIHFWLTP